MLDRMNLARIPEKAETFYHTDTVALLTRLMKERGIPVVTNALAKE